MASYAGKVYGNTPLFDPLQGLLVRAPLGEGPGWWAGAPSAYFDAETNAFYLAYRQRQPRDLGRGVELRIAASDNGVTFEDIWALPKASLGALSVERAALHRSAGGRWRLYLSYVHPEDRRWRIGLLEADEPDRFNTAEIETLLTAEQVGGEGVKDPNLFQIGPMLYLLASYATAEALPAPETAQKHASGDIFSTGLTRSRSGAALSGDGRHFHWLGDVSPLVGEDKERNTAPVPISAESQNPVWDGYCRRLTSLLPLDGGGYLAFYDGGASVAENYEEKTGLAVTFDLRTFYSLSHEAPALVSPYASGSLRYIDVLPVGRELFYYYEMAREDGAHELRVAIVERDDS